MAEARQIAGGSLAFFAGAVVLEHFLEPSLSPVESVVSEYARSGSGALLRAGFTAWAAAFGSTAAASWQCGRRAQAATMGVAAVGGAFLAAFNTQATQARLPTSAVLTLPGQLHDLGGELVIVSVAAAALIGAVTEPRSLSRGLIAASLATVGTFSAVLDDPWPGLRQRLLLCLAVGWHAGYIRSLRSRELKLASQRHLRS